MPFGFSRVQVAARIWGNAPASRVPKFQRQPTSGPKERGMEKTPVPEVFPLYLLVCVQTARSLCTPCLYLHGSRPLSAVRRAHGRRLPTSRKGMGERRANVTFIGNIRFYLFDWAQRRMAKPPYGERGIAWAMCLLRHGLLDLNRGTFLLAWGRHGRMSRDSARWLEARDVLLFRAILIRERPLDI